MSIASASFSVTTLEEEEDLIMTFQVVLIGTDGLLVCSDRKVAYRSPRENPGVPLDVQPEHGDKFLRSDTEEVVCFFAGGPQARAIALQIISLCSPDQKTKDWEASLRKAADSVPANSLGDEVLVIRPKVGDVFLVTRTGRDTHLSPVSDYKCTGVVAKCRFLAVNFWRPALVSQLRTLACLLLHYAAKERPESVGYGFDMMTVRYGEVRWERFVENDTRIESLRQEFEGAVRNILGMATRS